MIHLNGVIDICHVNVFVFAFIRIKTNVIRFKTEDKI